MKQKNLLQYLLITLFLVCFLIGVSSVTQAQDRVLPPDHTSAQPKPQLVATSSPQVQATSSVEGDAANFQRQLTLHRASLAKKMQDRVYNLLQNITGRMSATVFRFNNIAYRTEARMALLSQQGKSTGDAPTHLTKAHEALQNATRILNSDLGSFVQSENPQERFLNVHVQIKETGAYLFDAQTELRSAVHALTQSSQTTMTATSSNSR